MHSKKFLCEIERKIEDFLEGKLLLGTLSGFVNDMVAEDKIDSSDQELEEIVSNLQICMELFLNDQMEYGENLSEEKKLNFRENMKIFRDQISKYRSE